MGSLEESRRANEAVTAERDHYKEFWSAMNNYHTVMSRFQVPASSVGSVGFAGAPLPTQMGVYSSSPFPQFGAATSPLIRQTVTPPFAASGYPSYGAAANLSGMDLKPFQSQPHSQPVGEIVAPAPLIHDGTTNTPKPSTPEPTTVPPNTQSPVTPSKRILMKSIESYFASPKKPAVPVAIEDTYPISYPAYPKPSPPHATGDKEHGVLPPKYSEDLSSSTEEDDTSSPIDKRMEGMQEQGEHKTGDHHDWLH